MGEETPLRALSGEIVDGVHLLTDHSADWRDGGEQEVYDVLGRVRDRSTLSDELRRYEHSWETEYHFSSERAHIVRGLDIPPDATVLEVGAGCGAVTRYLGETVATVDAVEPDRVRARAAARRCEDLPGVAVHFGPVSAIPARPTYDVVVIIGVLEYVGARDGIEERIEWLRHCAATLKPGGTLVCAIENRLGVEYVAGASEEHLARPFAGLEDYPEPGPVRTFDRAGLTRIFEAAGLAPQVHHVFPDYKFTRLVFADALLDGDAAPVAWRTPVFPSAASPHRRLHLAGEERLWRSLVRAGLGGQFANSFLVLATKDPNARPLWPADQLAAFWGHRRRPLFAAETRLRRTPDGLVFDRRRLTGPEPTAREGTLELRPTAQAPLVAGTPIIELLEDADEAETVRLLGVWQQHVRRLCVAPPFDVELGPQHVLLTPDGSTASIDEEWFDGSYTVEDVIARGLLTAAIRLADACPPSRWPREAQTREDVFHHLAALAGVAVDRDAAVQREAEMLAAVIRVPPAEDPDPVAACRARLEQALACSVDEGPLGTRHVIPELPASHRALENRATELHHTVDWLHREVAARDEEIRTLREELEQRSVEPDSGPGAASGEPAGLRETLTRRIGRRGR